MRKCSYLLAAFLLFPATSFSSVDILSTDDVVYIAWNSGGQSHLMVSDSSSTRDFMSPELTLGEIHFVGEPYIVCATSNWNKAQDDSLYLLDPYSLSVESAYEVDYQDLIIGSYEPDEVHMSIRVARHSMNDTPVFISSNYTAYDFQTGELGVAAARFVPDGGTMDLILSEARNITFMFTYCAIISLSNPVSCCMPEPMCFWHWYFGWHGIDNVFYSGIHEIPSDRTLGLNTSSFFYDNCYYMEDMPRLKVAGSCTSEILTLWISAFGDSMCCTAFNAEGPNPTESYKFPYSMPPQDSPWAMSCNPSDEGLLFTWFEDGSIISRHYLDVWNPDTYVVQSGISDIDEENLSVCSDQDGYWVAWLEAGRSDPDFVFVPRDSVSSIGESEIEPPLSGLSISPVSNPAQGFLRFNVGGCIGEYEVFIYDVAGRLKLHGEFNEQDTVVFNEELPGGNYIVKVVNGSLSASCKVIVL